MRLPAFLRQVASLDLVLLLGGLVLVACTWFFFEVSDLVQEGKTQQLDERVILLLRSPGDPADPIGPRWLEEIGRDLTAVGGMAVLFLLTMTIAGYFLLTRRYGAMGFVLIATTGGLVLSGLLKQHYDRPRPELVPHLSYAMTSSFPSGHSMMSAVVYLTLGALLARMVEKKRLKLYFLGVAMVLTTLVGMSRVYLGVHFPTDVLAGWAAGLGWATLCWLVLRYLQQRGTVEPEE